MRIVRPGRKRRRTERRIVGSARVRHLNETDMLPSHAEQELAELKKRQVRVGMIYGFGSVLAGMGLFGKLADNRAAVHPIFFNDTVTTVILVSGAVSARGAVQITAVSRRRSELQRTMGLDQAKLAEVAAIGARNSASISRRFLLRDPKGGGFKDR